MQKFFWPLLITISLAVIWKCSSVPEFQLFCAASGSKTKLCSVLASSKFMEQFFIKRFILIFGSCGEEDVTTNELMDHLAVTAQTAEGNWHILVKLYGHLESKINYSKRFLWFFSESGEVTRSSPVLSPSSRSTVSCWQISTWWQAVRWTCQYETYGCRRSQESHLSCCL